MEVEEEGKGGILVLLLLAGWNATYSVSRLTVLQLITDAPRSPWSPPRG